MWLHASCQLDLDIPTPTPFLLMLRPRNGEQQAIACEQYSYSPEVEANEFVDPFGNFCQRLVSPAGHFRISTSVTAEVAACADVAFGARFVEIKNLPIEVLPFLLPSRFCESDRFSQAAADIVTGQSAGYDQCVAIVRYIQQTVAYTPGQGQELISAAEVNQRPNGVCRDMAHLGIALCRALSIPARMVVGYLEGLQPMDLHAWFEAFVGDRWYTFDATQFDPLGGRIAIAYGRDAADVAIFTQFGNAVDLRDMQIRVEAVNDPFLD
ncbi:transglutaminase domain-containing protein [Arenicella xantha]|uniref:Transglutaminase-like putative cysteine protease n=1 Tax=Arenicella xantha TaxID=644221 RepID=A0A395JRE6_9GAMM|nr:transglutaminase family protein [Arenicella xantha]RBP51270.1 transglutaminase-like putative cysteine protease [Arenicella xantha]